MWKKCFAAMLVCLTLLPWCHALEGMDVSVFQGNIDFSAARADGIEAVYIRASYGRGGVDAKFRQNAEAAARTGLHFGFYHFLEAADAEAARAEARHFTALIRSTGYDCRPALDFEVDAGLTSAQAGAVVRAFLTETEALLGVRPMLYVDVSNARRMEPDLAAYPLWIAQYDADAPDLADTPWTAYTGWQFTDRGRVSGVTGNVDRDVFTGGILLSDEELTPPAPERTYTVRRGDTLWALSRRYHTTVSELVRLNNIPNPDLIYVGQTLRLPDEDQPQGQLYTVRPGDTLWAIAMRYDTTVARLARLNNIPNPDLIFPGQVFRV